MKAKTFDQMRAGVAEYGERFPQDMYQRIN
jgi:hypothetical protein